MPTAGRAGTTIQLVQSGPKDVQDRRPVGVPFLVLVPDPVTGPAVTYIFQLRVVDRLGYDDIATRLNTDLERYPPPIPVDPTRAVGRWTWSSIHAVLHNPEYTGSMVRNRRATKKGGRQNPPSEWVWSPQSTQEPLVSRDVFYEAVQIARRRQGSRSGSAASSHPATKRSYVLRTYVNCWHCRRRMRGKTRRCDYHYYACEPKPGRDGTRDWYAEHPRSIWVREDHLIEAVHEFFATGSSEPTDVPCSPGSRPALRRSRTSTPSTNVDRRRSAPRSWSCNAVRSG